MNSVRAQTTAKILAFPTAARAAAVKMSRQAKFAAEIASLRAQKIVCTDAWYHQAAIEDETPDRNH